MRSICPVTSQDFPAKGSSFGCSVERERCARGNVHVQRYRKTQCATAAAMVGVSGNEKIRNEVAFVGEVRVLLSCMSETAA